MPLNVKNCKVGLHFIRFDDFISSDNSNALEIFLSKEIAEWSKKQGISLVIVGPEDPLANGLGDELKAAGVPCFGPEKLAAKIETDKNWAKLFMDRHKIPTARWKGFTDANEAKNFVNQLVETKSFHLTFF